MPFAGLIFSVGSPFQHPGFVDTICILYASILLKWIPRYVRLFMCSVTFPLKKTTGITYPTVLLLRVHHRACTLLGLSLDSVSWHHCSCCSWTAVTVVWVSLAVLLISLSAEGANTQLKPLFFRSASPFL